MAAVRALQPAGHRHTPVIAYLRSFPGETPAVLTAQAGVVRRAVAETQQHGAPYRLIWTFRDEGVDRSTRLRDVLALLERGKATVLLVARWDRLTSSKHVRAELRRHARTFGWELRLLDECGHLKGSGGSLRSARTTEGLMKARARGVRLGRPRRCPDDVLLRAITLRRAGATQAAVAELFNLDQVPTPGGGRVWYPSTVCRLLRTHDAKAVTAVDGVVSHT